MIPRIDKWVIHGVESRLSRVRSYARSHMPHVFLTFLVLSLIVLCLAPRIFITVHSGQAGVLYLRLSGGTVAGKVYGEGLHVIFPWDKIYIYDIRTQEAHPTIEVLTKNGLTVSLDVSIRYRADRSVLAALHQSVGQDYLQKIVIPEVVSKLRTAMGQFTAEDLFMTKRSIVEEAAHESAAPIAENHVVIENLLIKSIRLPSAIKKAVEDKIEQQHLAEAYVFRVDREKQEVERRRIEAVGHKTFHETIEPSLTPNILRWKSIEAIRELAASPGTKVLVMGAGQDGLPLILGSDGSLKPPAHSGAAPVFRPSKE